MIVLAGHIASCKKDFTDPVMSRVAFTFDWGALPAGAEIGEGMRLYFYAEDGQVYEMESDTTSFQGLLPVGNYQVLLRNSTAPGIRFRGGGRAFCHGRGLCRSGSSCLGNGGTTRLAFCGGTDRV